LLSTAQEDGGPLIELTYDQKNPSSWTSQMDDEGGVQADIDIFNTNIFLDENKKEVYQSPSIEFGAHELGHVLMEYGKLSMKRDQKSTNSEFYKQMLRMVRQQKNRLNNSEPFSEFFALFVQNTFATGLSEPIKPTYNAGFEKTEAKPTEFRKNE
jgi:hypothetical protein